MSYKALINDMRHIHLVLLSFLMFLSDGFTSQIAYIITAVYNCIIFLAERGNPE